MTNLATIGIRIRQIRESFGKSRDDFANTLGISRNTLQRYETDERKPDADFLIALNEKYNISANWILFGNSHQSENSDNDEDYLQDISEKTLIYLCRQHSPSVISSLISLLGNISNSKI